MPILLPKTVKLPDIPTKSLEELHDWALKTNTSLARILDQLYFNFQFLQEVGNWEDATDTQWAQFGLKPLTAAPTGENGMVAVCDGDTWDPVGDGDEHLMIYLEGGWKVIANGEVWDDLRILPGSFDFAGSADPTLSDWQPGGSGATYKVYKFQKNDEVFASCQMPHTYKEGSDLEFHIHWTPCDRGNEESTNKVGWKVDHSIADVNSAFPSSSTVDLSDACTGTDDLHEITSAVTVSGTGLNISHIIMLRIYRSDTGTDDTWSGSTAAQSPALLEFDIHFQIDTLGSSEETAK